VGGRTGGLGRTDGPGSVGNGACRLSGGGIKTLKKLAKKSNLDPSYGNQLPIDRRNNTKKETTGKRNEHHRCLKTKKKKKKKKRNRTNLEPRRLGHGPAANKVHFTTATRGKKKRGPKVTKIKSATGNKT